MCPRTFTYLEKGPNYRELIRATPRCKIAMHYAIFEATVLFIDIPNNGKCLILNILSFIWHLSKNFSSRSGWKIRYVFGNNNRSFHGLRKKWIFTLSPDASQFIKICLYMRWTPIKSFALYLPFVWSYVKLREVSFHFPNQILSEVNVSACSCSKFAIQYFQIFNVINTFGTSELTFFPALICKCDQSKFG